jgi:hypothetical protein
MVVDHYEQIDIGVSVVATCSQGPGKEQADHILVSAKALNREQLITRLNQTLFFH